MTVIIGNRYKAIHNIPRPNFAPAWEYVAMPEGSSSEAPVINPGPNDFSVAGIDRNRNLLNSGLEFFLTFFLSPNSRTIYFVMTCI